MIYAIPFTCSESHHCKISDHRFYRGHCPRISPHIAAHSNNLCQCLSRLCLLVCRSLSCYGYIYLWCCNSPKSVAPAFSNISILAPQPPLFPHTVAYGMCSVPPHIPYPSASLRERYYASVALQPLPTASTFPFSSHLLYLKIFFSMR